MFHPSPDDSPALEPWLAQLAGALEGPWLLPPPPPPAPGVRPPPPHLAPQAQYFGAYELLGEVGKGGVARVLRVRHVHPHYQARPTALKILQAQAGGDARIVELFRREAGVHSLIRHDNIVETFEAGVIDNQPFLAMAFVAGGDMDHLLARLKPKHMRLEPALSVFIITEVLAGLGFAHSLRDLREQPLGLVHRDVNPANIFLGHDGRVRLGDFGVAFIQQEKRRQLYEIAGKAGYFAPEHLTGKGISHRSDLFAIGATLFELLAGERLFAGPDDDAILKRNEVADLGDLAARLPAAAHPLLPVLRSALALSPRDRPGSAEELRAALLPFAAPRRTAKLLLQSLVQHFFSAELSREEAIANGGKEPRRALARAWQMKRGRTAKVAVALGDRQANAAMTSLLAPLGFGVDEANSGQAWQAALSAAPDLVVVAAGEPTGSLAQTAFAQNGPQQAQAGAMPLVVVSAAEFSLAAAEWALACKAVDLWVRPFPAHRALRGVGRALGRALERPEAMLSPDFTNSVAPAPHGRALLLVGSGAKEALKKVALPPNDRVTHVNDAAAALAITCVASFDAIVVDASEVPDLAQFVQEFRAAIGMGTVPAVAVGATALFATPALPRFVWLPPGGDVLAAIDAAQRAAAGQELRAYTRFDAKLRVQLRSAGQVVEAETVNISRRGLLLASPVLPSVGSELGLRIELGRTGQSGAPEVVVVAGRAQRAVVRPQAQADAGRPERTELGVALGQFAGGSEALWVLYILDQVPAPSAGLMARASKWLFTSGKA